MAVPTVVKISGHCLDDPAQLRAFAQIVAGLPKPLLIVHGGGKEITDWQAQQQIRPHYVAGLRVTDARSMALVEMVLSGVVNKRLVRHLLAAGVDAQGLSGVDRGLLRAQPMQHDTVDMGFTGEVQAVRAQVIWDCFALGVTPVISPVSLGADSSLNLNADTVAAALAAALAAEKVVFVSNVAGLIIAGEIVPSLTAAQAEAYIASGDIGGGMIPKVRSALEVLAAGVQEALISDLAGWANAAGTTFTK